MLLGTALIKLVARLLGGLEEKGVQIGRWRREDGGVLGVTGFNRGI